MRIIIALIFLCQSAGGQSIVLSGDGQSIVVSGSAVQTQEAHSTSVEPVVIKTAPIVVAPVASAIRKVKQHFLVSETWCANCPRAKARFLANRWPERNVLTIAECKRMFGFGVPHVPYEFEWEVQVSSDPPVSLIHRHITHQPPPSQGEILTPNGRQGLTLPVQKADAPNRYIQWPGYGTIDLQSYNRNCNCPMCQSIRAQQQEYQRQLREYQQAALPDDQKPCPHETVEQMLDLMQLTPDDVLADLGCGDGRILIAAAKRGIRGIGVELDHARAAAARQAIRDSGLSHLITVEQGDARNFDSSRAAAITAYLYPTLLAELAPKFRSVRVAASPFHEVPGLTMVQHGDVWIYRNGLGPS